MLLAKYRRKKNGVPVLSKAEIDKIAEGLLLDFCPAAMQIPMEIDIDSFVLNCLGLKQDFQYLSHNGIYLGMTVFRDTNKVPVYNPESNRAEYISAKARTVIIDNSLLEEDKEHRYRYTMGHEGSHDILHRDYFSFNPDQLSLFDAVTGPIAQCRAVNATGGAKPVREWNDRATMEWQANYLSSALLMPRSMVRKLIESLEEEHWLFRDTTYIQSVVKVFNVSSQAAEYRLRELGFIKDEI